MEMNESTRQLMLRICDGDTDQVPKILFLIFKDYPRHHEMFEWLVRHRIIGKTFLGFFRESHQNSPMLLTAFLISKIEHEKKMRPIIFGEDFIPRG